MADILLFKKNKGKITPGPGHWMDDLTPTQIDMRRAIYPAFLDKYEARTQVGDILDIQPDGFYGNRPNWGKHAFYLLQVPNLSVATAKQYRAKWNRVVSVQRTLNDTQNHIYEYTITLNQSSLSGAEQFRAHEFMKRKLPKDISVVSKSITQVILRLEPLKGKNVIAGNITPEERRDEFEDDGRAALIDFRRLIRKQQYRIRTEDLPQTMKDKLANDEAIILTKTQVQTYLENKALI